jgi:GH18 family chitinase
MGLNRIKEGENKGLKRLYPHTNSGSKSAMVNRIVAFLPGYATDATRKLDIATIPGDRITDLIYCFAGFQQQGTSWLPTFPEPNDTQPGKRHNVAKLIALKTRWPALNIVMSIGGWNHSHQGDSSFKTTPAFTAICASPQTRQAFVAACIKAFIKPYPVIGYLFGGIDIDWEYPASGADKHGLTLLLQEFRSQLDKESKSSGRSFTLSACWGAGAGQLEFSTLANTLDWFNVMTYLAHRPDKKNMVTDFGAPLYSSPDEPHANASWTIDGVVNRFLAAGVPASKIVLGVNAYALTYAGVPNVNHGLYQPFMGPGPGSLGKTELLEYKDLVANYLPTYESYWDDITKCSYLYSPTQQIWICHESAQSIAARATYANAKGIGGILLWELSADVASDLYESTGLGAPALIDAMPRGIHGLANTVVLGQRSAWAPAIAYRDGRFFLALARPGPAHHLEVGMSSDSVSKFGGMIFTDTSNAAPALAVHNNQLFLAWTELNNKLSVASVSLSMDPQGKVTIAGLANKVVLSETSDAGPALASQNGRLFLAWKGVGDRKLNLICSSDNGATFGSRFTFFETSDAGPALVAHIQQLIIAWRGSGNENLNVAEVDFLENGHGGFGVTGLKNKVTLNETSDAPPALASDNRRLFLGWKGTGNGNLNLLLSSDGGASFGGKSTTSERSDAAPSLASDGFQLPIVWKSASETKLSVAQIAFY